MPSSRRTPVKSTAAAAAAAAAPSSTPTAQTLEPLEHFPYVQRPEITPLSAIRTHSPKNGIQDIHPSLKKVHIEAIFVTCGNAVDEDSGVLTTFWEFAATPGNDKTYFAILGCNIITSMTKEQKQRCLIPNEGGESFHTRVKITISGDQWNPSWWKNVIRPVSAESPTITVELDPIPDEQQAFATKATFDTYLDVNKFAALASSELLPGTRSALVTAVVTCPSNRDQVMLMDPLQTHYVPLMNTTKELRAAVRNSPNNCAVLSATDVHMVDFEDGQHVTRAFIASNLSTFTISSATDAESTDIYMKLHPSTSPMKAVQRVPVPPLSRQRSGTVTPNITISTLSEARNYTFDPTRLVDFLDCLVIKTYAPAPCKNRAGRFFQSFEVTFQQYAGPAVAVDADLRTPSQPSSASSTQSVGGNPFTMKITFFAKAIDKLFPAVKERDRINVFDVKPTQWVPQANSGTSTTHSSSSTPPEKTTSFISIDYVSHLAIMEAATTAVTTATATPSRKQPRRDSESYVPKQL